MEKTQNNNDKGKREIKVCHSLFSEYKHIKTYEQYDIILLYSDIKGFIWDFFGQESQQKLIQIKARSRANVDKVSLTINKPTYLSANT